MLRTMMLVLLLWAASGAWAEPGRELMTPPKIQAEAIDSALEQGVLLLDVRTAQELKELGTLPGHVHIPLDELETRWHELPKDRQILTA